MWRELLARAIESNGGYSRGYHDRFALEWDVSLNCGVPDANDLMVKHSVFETLAENWGVGKEKFCASVPTERLNAWIAEWDDEGNLNQVWDRVREGMAEMFHGSVRGTSYGSVSPDVAKRFGLTYESPKRFVRKGPMQTAYYPAKVPGWKIVDQYANVPDFDAAQLCP